MGDIIYLHDDTTGEGSMAYFTTLIPVKGDEIVLPAGGTLAEGLWLVKGRRITGVGENRQRVDLYLRPVRHGKIRDYRRQEMPGDEDREKVRIKLAEYNTILDATPWNSPALRGYEGERQRAQAVEFVRWASKALRDFSDDAALKRDLETFKIRVGREVFGIKIQDYVPPESTHA